MGVQALEPSSSNKVVGSVSGERPFYVEFVCSAHGSFSRYSGSVPQTKHIRGMLKCVFPLLDSFQPCSKDTFLFLLLQSAGVRQGTDRRVRHSDKPHITERNLLRHGKGRRPDAVELSHRQQVTKQSLRLVELRLILNLKVEVYHVRCVFPS